MLFQFFDTPIKFHLLNLIQSVTSFKQYLLSTLGFSLVGPTFKHHFMWFPLPFSASHYLPPGYKLFSGIYASSAYAQWPLLWSNSQLTIFSSDGYLTLTILMPRFTWLSPPPFVVHIQICARHGLHIPQYFSHGVTTWPTTDEISRISYALSFFSESFTSFFLGLVNKLV